MNEEVLISNELSRIEEFIHRNGKSYSQIVVLVDENTSSACWPNLAGACPKLEKAELIEVPAGESSKSIEIAVQVWNALRDLGVDRDGLLINLGGGVVCDLGGFIASTYLRGIDFIQIPTSLLAQVDASIGGKNGIDLDDYKNLVGTINLPKLSFIHSSFLETLDQRQIMNGFAEMIKHGLLQGGEHLNLIKKVEQIDIDSLEPLMEMSIAFKQSIVNADLHESGQRKILNLGHSFGHAIESIALENGFDLLHGEAVAIGLIAEAELAVIKGISTRDYCQEIQSLILKHFHIQLPNYFEAGSILNYLRSDKKNRDSKLLFVLLKEPGTPVIDIEVSEVEIGDAWGQALKALNG